MNFTKFCATNQMTFSGFLLLVANCIGATIMCPMVTTCNVEPPRWFFFVVAFNLWLYQTLDNIDGKQARRTGTSSPLGELFDHGCDSLFLILTGMPWFMSMHMTNWQAFIFLTQGTVAFYASHWEEYHSHKLILGLVANPTEVQYWIMSIFVTTGLFGTQFWTQTLTDVLPKSIVAKLLEIGVSADFLAKSQTEFIIFIVWFGIVFTMLFNGYEACKAAVKNGEGVFAPIGTFAPYAFQVAILTAWASWSKWNVIEKQPWMFLAMHGLLFSYLCVRNIRTRFWSLALSVCLSLPLSLSSTIQNRN